MLYEVITESDLSMPAFEVAELLDEEQAYRRGAYGVLARLLRSPPDRQILDQVSGFARVPSYNFV